MATTAPGQYDNRTNDKDPNDVILFMDAVHPQHNPVLGCGCIKRGKDVKARSNSGRKPMNINGAVDLRRLEPAVRSDESINADSTITLFDQLLLVYAYSGCS